MTKTKTSLKSGERGVSPVIGVILMVAITVILAAVIGTFVLGLGQNVSTTTPQASVTFENGDASGVMTITHEGGDTISEATKITANGQPAGNFSSEGVTLGPGESVDWNVTANSSVSSKQDVTIRLVDLESGNVIAKGVTDLE